jgi:uncharacterized membrane protein HdeD (DUF308 family)
MAEWVPLLFGVIFIITGIWILRSPIESYEQITKMIGVIILIKRGLEVRKENRNYWKWELILGVMFFMISLTSSYDFINTNLGDNCANFSNEDLVLKKRRS